MFDFGGITSFGHNYLQLNKGSNVENDGDGAIGGSIYFGTNNKFNRGSEIRIRVLGQPIILVPFEVCSSIKKSKQKTNRMYSTQNGDWYTSVWK